MIAELGLRTRAEVNPDLHSRMVVAGRRLAALDRALAMLGRGPRSMFDLKRRLIARGEEPSAVMWAIRKLESEGMANDESFAIQYCRARFARGVSRSVVLSGLLRAAVARDVAERAIEQVVSEEGWDEVVASRKAAVRRIRSLSGLDRPTAKRRLAAFLRRRGYGAAAVRDALQRLSDTDREESSDPSR
jgi:regulatory protein